MRSRGWERFPVEWGAIGAAAVAVAAFLVWAAIRLDEILIFIYAHSDSASAPVLAELMDDRGSAEVVLGYYPWYEGLLPLHWTRWVPNHIAFWKGVPLAIYFATVALAGWTVARAVSRPAGAAVALAMAAPAPFVILMLGAPNQRLPALAHVVLLAAFLVTAPRVAGWPEWRRWAWAGALALTLAPGVASDTLIVIGGALPFLVALAAGWRLDALPRATALLASGACLAGVALGKALQAILEADGIVFTDEGFFLASGERVLSNAGLLLEIIALFVHGLFASGEVKLDAFTVTREVVAVAAVLGAAAFLYLLARRGPRIVRDRDRPAEQRLLAVYWVVSLAALALAFVIVTASVGMNAVRYVSTLWSALLTLIAIIWGRRAVPGLAVLAAGAALLGCWELKGSYYTPPITHQATPEESELVADFAAEHGLDHGYAGYWDAMPITLHSDFQALAYPIQPCGPGPEDYCPFVVHRIESWYEPRAGEGTFYVVGDQRLDPPLGPPPASWGRPVARARLGRLTVYAFDYDISARLRSVEPGAVPPGRPD